MEIVATAPAQDVQKQSKVAVIDCDIHNAPASNEVLSKYLPARWRRHLETYGARPAHSGGYYPRLHPSAARSDSWPPTGGRPGSDLKFMQEQLLDTWGIEYGVLNPLYGAGGQPNLEYSAALSRALNEWQQAEWLDPEPRLRASIVVPYEDGQMAAAEVDRCAADPRFIQLILIARTQEPLGRRKYWPMYEAAVRHNLPVGIHFGGNAGWPITGAGWPSFYLEDHVGMPQSFQPQIISLIYEGVFEHFPDLKIVLIEGGFAWLPSLMWRMDRSWQRLGDEIPHLQRPPSSFIRENFWITTQPIEEPSQPAYFNQLLEQLDMNDKLLFATDYPHWDFDAPDRALPNTLSPELKRDILAENARAFYRF
jgi:predicted TIM-barrel fold metal-dependent hydrolase